MGGEGVRGVRKGKGKVKGKVKGREREHDRSSPYPRFLKIQDRLGEELIAQENFDRPPSCLPYFISKTFPAVYGTVSPLCPFPFVGLPTTASHSVWIPRSFPKFFEQILPRLPSFSTLPACIKVRPFPLLCQENGNGCMSSQSGSQRFSMCSIALH